jgi:CDP-2,3-bis-(O-geranylgeranyl)-sn-glycerol synthase
VAKRILGDRFAYPLDFKFTFMDGRPLFGSSKTIRGVLVSLIVTTAAAPLLGVAPWIGSVIAVTAMAGDLFSSFCKRRLGVPASGRATGLDQIPESLFPVLACRNALSLSSLDMIAAVLVFFLAEISLSGLLFKLHLRDRPY